MYIPSTLRYPVKHLVHWDAIDLIEDIIEIPMKDFTITSLAISSYYILIRFIDIPQRILENLWNTHQHASIE
jgi:hypothetical protein